MKLNEMKRGSEVFVDSNILIYHFTGLSDDCSNFLGRCEMGELNGMTSVNVILEVLHRLMMVEAVHKNLVKPPNIVKKLGRAPQKIKELNDYFVNTEKIQDMGITIKPLTFETIIMSHMVRLASGLMVNDSVIIAVMKNHGVELLATNDKAFENVKEIDVYAPEDMNFS
ncbi:PIN domain protein [delta proteobacterium NaphS2]|nr:PIN domain protein [delta proteobacterium NaphS2]